ncbi:glycosyl-transferase for dystroglycan-domain-containing protein [Pelagophyceae sp. CCMP2097]|nr:glycosyl-transferase for dystroglycan-domain-containing protein [Pelagophyceae sp. CCMP2097]
MAEAWAASARATANALVHLPSAKSTIGSITVTTQCSLDRLPRLAALAAAWDGPVVCAVHLPAAAKEPFDVLRAFQIQVESSSKASLHLIALWEPLNDGLYPINALRNASLDAAKTSHVWILDVDFIPSKNASATLQNAVEDLCDMQVLVVPAFEVAMSLGNLETRSALQEACSAGSAEGFHASGFAKGHGPTDFEKWFSADEAEKPYAALYAQGFEPYIVASKAVLPRFDERFRGYGLNKVVHALAMHSAGLRFSVVCGAWCAARQHARSEEWQRMYDPSAAKHDPLQKRRIQALFDRAKGELSRTPTALAVDALDGDASDGALKKQPAPSGTSTQRLQARVARMTVAVFCGLAVLACCAASDEDALATHALATNALGATALLRGAAALVAAR